MGALRVTYVYNANLTGGLYFNDVGGDYTRDVDPVYYPTFTISSDGFLKPDGNLTWAFCWYPGSGQNDNPVLGSVYLGKSPGCTFIKGLKIAPYQK